MSEELALKNSEYKPTQKESALLDVLLNPEHRTKSITEKCRLADCSRQVYYEAFAKDEFKALYEQKSKELIKQHIGPVINAVVREALRGSFPQQKLLLEMAGMYTEKEGGNVILVRFD